MTTQWNYPASSPQAIQQADELAHAVGINPITARLLIRRGIRTPLEVQAFLSPSLEELHDPFLMKDMDRAVARLNHAVGHRERIMIYGDYDVDGTTSVALVYRFLRETVASEKDLNYYIPDRNDDGYGVSRRGIDVAHQWGAKLIIVLDCGIKAVEEVAYAKQLGIDFIICDHHNPDETLPEAVAVLDPKREDNTYPFEHLSGCGIGFKLMQAFAQSNGISPRILYNHLDLLALSIAADIVPVIGENRILAYHGLRQLNKRPSLGVGGIIRIAGLEGQVIDMESIVFKIGPRINASGRMMNGRDAVALLLAKTMNEALLLSDALDEYNTQRRELDLEVTEKAIEAVQRQEELASKKIIITHDARWHKGVIGIVASRLADRYRRPTVVLTRCGDYYSGSGRSVGGFDIYRAIESCRDLLVNFGGHTYAVGMTIPPENLTRFTERLEAYVEAHLDDQSLMEQIDIDVEVPLSKVSSRLVSEVLRLAPFGAWNEKPTFLSRRLKDSGHSRLVGRSGQHLKLSVTDNHRRLRPLHAIAFGQTELAPRILAGEAFSLVYHLEENRFAGRRSIQLQVKDIRMEEPAK